MASTVEITPSEDNQRITIFIPMTLKRKGRKRQIVAPEGSNVNPDRDEALDATLFSALARAHYWNNLLKSGECESITEIVELENFDSTPYVSRILRLTTLAPDIQEAIVQGKQPPSLSLADLMSPFPIEWGEQREQFGFDSTRGNDR